MTIFEDHQATVDWVKVIARNNKGEIIGVFDSRKRTRKQKISIILRRLFLGQKHHNTMTNSGFPVSGALIAGLTANPFIYVAIGTGTTPSAATDTALQTEVKRKSGTPTQITTTVTNDTVVWDVIFGQSGDGMSTTIAVTEIGVLNASSNGTLLTHFASSTVMATITPNTAGTGDTFEAIVHMKNEQGS
jgi:hypothetical protein